MCFQKIIKLWPRISGGPRISTSVILSGFNAGQRGGEQGRAGKRGEEQGSAGEGAGA